MAGRLVWTIVSKPAMFALPPSSTTLFATAAFAIGESVRVTELHDDVAPGAEGRVVGYYRNDPPRTLVAFDAGPCAVPDTGLERAS